MNDQTAVTENAERENNSDAEESGDDDGSEESERKTPSTESSNSEEENESEQQEEFTTKALAEMKHYDELKPIGRGGFGRILKATHRLNGVTYALKEMSKARILSRRCLS